MGLRGGATLRKTFLALLFLLITTTCTLTHLDDAFAQSNTYESIDIHVQLNDDGSADVTERWIAHLYQDTENFIVKENLGKSKIENFTVTEDGQQYEFLKKWDINASRSEKMFKNGIVKTSKGVELSWGIGEYGTHEYILEYTVTDIIKELKDAQTLFWTFSNHGVTVPRSNVRIEISAPKNLNKDDEQIWAFGYEGDIEFIDGTIVMQSDQPLTQENYVTVLVKFAENTFVTGDKVNKKFSQIEKQAFKGSDYETFWQRLWNYIKMAAYFIGGLIFVIILYLMNRGGSSRNELQVGSPRKFKRRHKEEYYRDYPFDDYFLDAYYFVYKMGLGSFNTILTSFLLKWIHEDQILMYESTSGMFNRKTQMIRFIDDKVDIKTDEGRLFHSIKKLVDENNEVTDRQLAKWAERNYKGLRNWEQGVMNKSVEKLLDYHYLTDNKKKLLLFSWGNYELTESGKEIEDNIYKYVNYLHDFSLLSERDAVNVKLWDEIMIWAAYLNLTDVVMKQFKRLYSEYMDESKFKEDTVRRSSHVANEMERQRRRRERAARREQRRRSRGEGGRASTSGGGGSYGGGSGGGTR